MRPPRRININGVVYKVVEIPYIDPKTVDNGKDDDIICGAWDFWQSTIEIRNDLPIARKRINLIHEVLHGITEGMGIDEEQIDEIAWGIYDTFKRNRSLLRYLWRIIF